MHADVSHLTHLGKLEQACVLIADDIEANRDLLRRRLTRLGFSQLIEARDGAEALECMRKQRVDLVLLDIMMPVMTGFDVLEVMRKDGLIDHIAVIVVSALNEMTSVVRAIELGAADFLFKPIEPTLLRARVRTTLEKKLLNDQLTLELARKRSELEEARQLQMSLRPLPFQSGKWNIDVLLEPAREVGGDLVDHMLLANGRHLMVLGDVSGKGAGAALMMARCHSLVRSLPLRADSANLFAQLGLAAAAVNAELARGNVTCTFITLVLALLDPLSGRFDYVVCGHLLPYLRRAGGQTTRLPAAPALPLGIDEGAEYAVESVQLEPGDALLILSDGVTEAVSESDQFFGDQRVLDWLAPAPQPLGSLLSLVREFESGLPAADDVSCLMVLRAPE